MDAVKPHAYIECGRGSFNLKSEAQSTKKSNAYVSHRMHAIAKCERIGYWGSAIDANGICSHTVHTYTSHGHSIHLFVENQFSALITNQMENAIELYAETSNYAHCWP